MGEKVVVGNHIFPELLRTFCFHSGKNVAELKRYFITDLLLDYVLELLAVVLQKMALMFDQKFTKICIIDDLSHFFELQIL